MDVVSCDGVELGKEGCFDECKDSCLVLFRMRPEGKKTFRVVPSGRAALGGVGFLEADDVGLVAELE